MKEESTPSQLSLEAKLFAVGTMAIIIGGFMNMNEVWLHSLWIGWLIFLLSLAWIR